MSDPQGAAETDHVGHLGLKNEGGFKICRIQGGPLRGVKFPKNLYKFSFQVHAELYKFLSSDYSKSNTRHYFVQTGQETKRIARSPCWKEMYFVC